MADSGQTPKKLIDNIIDFINNERELYGDFQMGGRPGDQDIPGTSKQSNPENKMDSDSDGGNSAREKTADSASAGDEVSNVYEQIEQCHTLEELQVLCEAAGVLRTDLEDTRLVFGVGNPHADLMLVGEAPGAEEDRQGEPFVGRAGKLLNKILESINFSRDDVYIANILKHRPPNNRNPRPEERKRSLPFLLRQVDLVNPALILSLGKVSAQTLLGTRSSLTKMRGTFHNFRGNYELLATYHPAALLRHPKWKQPTWEDVQMLRKRYDELGCSP